MEDADISYPSDEELVTEQVLTPSRRRSSHSVNPMIAILETGEEEPEGEGGGKEVRDSPSSSASTGKRQSGGSGGEEAPPPQQDQQQQQGKGRQKQGLLPLHREGEAPNSIEEEEDDEEQVLDCLPGSGGASSPQRSGGGPSEPEQEEKEQRLHQEQPGRSLGQHVMEIFMKHAHETHRKMGERMVKTSSLAAIMRELGDDWDEAEQKIAERAMDPESTGVVAFSKFCDWWSN